jgi:quaternary ammonium compound-resistance protein SugE
MKLSMGLARPLPTAAFFSLFMLGATLQALGMKRADLGVSYIFVLGVEALITFFLSVLFMKENYSPARVAAVVMVVAGIVWLEHS